MFKNHILKVSKLPNAVKYKISLLSLNNLNK